MPKPAYLRKTVEMAIRRFPNAGNQTVARVLFNEYPEMFRSVEAARGHVRVVRGAHGEGNRRQTASKELFQPCKSPGDPFPKLPDGKTAFNLWEAVTFDGEIRALILPDLHIPYHDHEAIRLAVEFGRKFKANFILLNGDFGDFYSVSFWENDPRKRNFESELNSMKDALGYIRGRFRQARIVFKDGNHEERWYRYGRVRAPDIYGIPDFTIPKILDFAKYGIEHVSEMRPIRLGRLNVIHGHEYKFNISNPVNPARGFFLRCKVNCIGSHMHQTSQHSEKNLEGKVISTWSTGCLCDLHPEYRPLNSHNLGFATVEVTSDGAFEVDNKKILHGKVF